MERKEIRKLVFAIIALVLIAIFPFKVLFTESDTNLRLLAIGIILTIVLGGWNMLKSFFKESALSRQVSALEEANRLTIQKMEDEKKQALQDIINTLLPEIEVNQSYLKSPAEQEAAFKQFIGNPNSIPDETKTAFEGHITKDWYDIKQLLKQNCFQKTMYSSGFKLGMLNQELSRNIILYYGKLDKINQKLGLIYELEPSNDMEMVIKRVNTKEYFEMIAECFELGNEIIRALKENDT